MDGFGRNKKFKGTKEVCGIWVGKNIDLSEKYLCFSLDLLFCDLNFSFHTCGRGNGDDNNHFVLRIKSKNVWKMPTFTIPEIL